MYQLGFQVVEYTSKSASPKNSKSMLLQWLDNLFLRGLSLKRLLLHNLLMTSFQAVKLVSLVWVFQSCTTFDNYWQPLLKKTQGLHASKSCTEQSRWKNWNQSLKWQKWNLHTNHSSNSHYSPRYKIKWLDQLCNQLEITLSLETIGLSMNYRPLARVTDHINNYRSLQELSVTPKMIDHFQELQITSTITDHSTNYRSLQEL